MRTLILGAGAVGGYFGARLAQAGRDVTFLVRAGRQALLGHRGLHVSSPHGDIHLERPATRTVEEIDGPYDVVLLACKAFDLESALDTVQHAIGPGTAMLPLLNGMRHLEVLGARFPRACVLGGVATISVDLDAAGRIVQLADAHTISLGALSPSEDAAAQAVVAEFADAGFAVSASRDIELEMWEKWAFIATAAGATCLLRGTVGDIVAAGAQDVVTSLYGECSSIAQAHGVALRPEASARAQKILTAEGSPFTASMYRDVERGVRTEANEILGDLYARGTRTGISAEYPVLRLALAHLLTYEARRRRLAGS
jgi:2-dehydropantoate 2-reductase